MDDIKLGQKVRDRITGLTGIASGRVSYITGCDQILVQPPVETSGKFVEGRFVDVTRLEVLDVNIVFDPDNPEGKPKDEPAAQERRRSRDSGPDITPPTK